jgi:exopolysaccharide biosynthesis polyprenyl glycosylphosphotransferase
MCAEQVNSGHLGSNTQRSALTVASVAEQDGSIEIGPGWADQVAARGDMLRISDADGTPIGALPKRGEEVVDLRAGPPNGAQRRDEGFLLAVPERKIPQRERRAVGRLVSDLGHLFDAAAVGVPLLLSSFVRDHVISRGVVLLFVMVVALMLWPTHRRGRHLIAPAEGLVSVIARVGLAPVITWGLLALVRLGEGATVTRMVDIVAIIQIVVLTFPLVLLGRVLSYRLAVLARNRGYDLEDTLVLGSGPTGLEIAQAIEDNPNTGLVPCGFIDRFDTDSDLPLVGRPENLPEILTATGVRNVVIAFGATSEEELVKIVRRCHDHDVQFFVVPRLFELGVSAGEVGHEVDGLPLVKVSCRNARSWKAKRAFDVVTSLLLLALTAPVFLACALGVKLTSPGPVFFRQVRVGIGGRPFEILKFRTMKVNDDSTTQWSVDDDDRVTSIGKFLRPSHLDELPQLLNVLRGEMSLIGPRPERPHFVEQFSAEIDGYEHRHRVPVGITGWAQVNGYWGDTSIERRVRLDNRYIENWSIWRDLVIALRTFPTLFGKRR